MGTTYYLLSTTYLLPTTYYLLPTTYYLLPTTYYLLPTTYYPLVCVLGFSLNLFILNYFGVHAWVQSFGLQFIYLKTTTTWRVCLGSVLWTSNYLS